jgi:hypothetical protein
MKTCTEKVEVMQCIVEYVKLALQLLGVMNCLHKCSINLITNLNPACSHTTDVGQYDRCLQCLFPFSSPLNARSLIIRVSEQSQAQGSSVNESGRYRSCLLSAQEKQLRSKLRADSSFQALRCCGEKNFCFIQESNPGCPASLYRFAPRRQTL